MDIKIDIKKRMSDLTVEEFIQLTNRLKEEKKFVYGLKGLARFLGCGRTKAYEIKSSGVIDDAIYQNGNIIMIDKEKVLELLKKSNKK